MRALLDACVLYPTVMREVLLGVARRGLFRPLWSARILEEWARAAARPGGGGEAVARGEIALLRAAWPGREVADDPVREAALYLPDPADRHVLAAAIAGGAEVIVTLNLRDFPARVLAGHGLRAAHPDAFLRALFAQDPEAVRAAGEEVRAEAERLAGEPWEMRRLMKKAGLPRLGKALAG